MANALVLAHSDEFEVLQRTARMLAVSGYFDAKGDTPHAIAQLADICVALQKPDDGSSDSTEIRILKNRFTGEVGSAGILNYNRETGRLTESVF